MSMTYYRNWVKSQENLFQQKFKRNFQNGKYAQVKPTKASIGHGTNYKLQQNKINKQKCKELERQKYKNKFDYIKPKVAFVSQTPRHKYNNNKNYNTSKRPFSAKK